MAVVRMVDSQISRRLVELSAPRKAASTSAPLAPTPAASVGVASPPRIEPRTATISSRGGARPFSKALISGFCELGQRAPDTLEHCQARLCSRRIQRNQQQTRNQRTGKQVTNEIVSGANTTLRQL